MGFDCYLIVPEINYRRIRRPTLSAMHAIVQKAALRGALKGIAVFSAAALSACASHQMDAATCASTDWQALGIAAGKTGKPVQEFGNLAGPCIKQGVIVNEDAYLVGWSSGLEAYCTRRGGFDAGARGDEYEGVCSAETEKAFLAAFEQGETLHDLEQAAKRSRKNHRDAIGDLDRNEYNLAIARNRYINPTLANVDRETARLDIEHHSREVARLTEAIPRLAEVADQAERELAEYTETLAGPFGEALANRTSANN